MSNYISPHEFRVSWRREHDKTKRTRIYQTRAGAENFAHFLRVSSWDEADQLDDVAVEILKRLGNPIEVHVQRRIVGEWLEVAELHPHPVTRTHPAATEREHLEGLREVPYDR